MGELEQTYSSLREEVVEKNIYFMWKFFPFVLLAAAIIETVLFFTVNGSVNVQNDEVYLLKNWTAFHAFFPTVHALTAYAVFYFLFSCTHASYLQKKIYYLASIYFAFTGYIFGHPGFNSLVLLYVVPILISAVFSLRAIKITSAISGVLVATYCIYQGVTRHTTYYIPLGVIILFIQGLCSFLAMGMNNVFDELFMNNVAAVNYSDEIDNSQTVDKLTGAWVYEKLYRDINTLVFKSVACIDIDDFNRINEKFGDEVGDWVLINLVKNLSAPLIRIYRYEGDKFVIASLMTKEKLFESVSEGISRFKADTEQRTGGTMVTASCGITGASASIRDDIQKGKSLLFLLKKTGKDRIKFFN